MEWKNAMQSRPRNEEPVNVRYIANDTVRFEGTGVWSGSKWSITPNDGYKLAEISKLPAETQMEWSDIPPELPAALESDNRFFEMMDTVYQVMHDRGIGCRGLEFMRAMEMLKSFCTAREAKCADCPFHSYCTGCPMEMSFSMVQQVEYTLIETAGTPTQIYTELLEQVKYLSGDTQITAQLSSLVSKLYAYTNGGKTDVQT